MKLPINYAKAHHTKRKQARLLYIIEQEGKCCHCNELLSGEPSADVLTKPINMALFPKSMFNYPVHLHHCHKTHMSIGAIHARCNAYLWQYRGE